MIVCLILMLTINVHESAIICDYRIYCMMCQWYLGFDYDLAGNCYALGSKPIYVW